MHRNSTSEVILNSFAEDVNDGLSSAFKNLPSKYFYDDEGSRIFQQIMALPEYYLTNCEFEILKNRSSDIFKALDFKVHFNVVELGAGDGSKTLELLKALEGAKANFTYLPVDISSEAISILKEKLQQELPTISINPMVGDYFEILKEIGSEQSPSLVLFLGSNIGNYPHSEAVELLQLVQQELKANDKLLIGFDLKKNPAIIAPAYNDASGITKAFNINLLTRINRELKADFDLDKFDFYSHYNPESGAVKSYLISLAKQEVDIGALNKKYQFEANELIYTELSKKYSLSEIEEMATNTGFVCSKHFLDSKNYFSDSLFCKEGK
ncbi:MAG: L-histidine N(alpha)-methyltransferase [Cyclobacteriaceae bacterium]|nr:L-histidine N(alpha)-methyltransferase [Cyclobacteriaceae bacterium]